ncbi:type I-E CRISPR-associated protein Cas5/CasD [Candidatus Nitrotoga sp. AM1P]|uniref:type I-E CRISPR-associated protein Cas5/CasD n=1 Tax=Candidatus Nitrotoga sp. AM1P TaxID=2559597 RepID=UPI0010B468F7|nr:type I-E CRISPR-associated protein Cas5/CasD [Candidatus Nitrotoga sp. AM1P]BBJ22998.1 type I-E CRISPR-associated protein CasD [Candidatus Nitrotoga sp. AM1P]
MYSFLILKLDGVMQAWGDHTYEDYRPTVNFPTRSGLLGLLAACMGIERSDVAGLAELDKSLCFSIRADSEKTIKLTDFHTVMNARKVDIRKSGEYPVVSRREYLCDAKFTVAIGLSEHTSVTFDTIQRALKQPVYTPVLGRRSCPISRPLLVHTMEAVDALAALAQFEPNQGTIYTDSPALRNDRQIRLRDVPRHARVRQFATRMVSVYPKGSTHVPE